jgi:hypothetical protein
MRVSLITGGDVDWLEMRPENLIECSDLIRLSRSEFFKLDTFWVTTNDNPILRIFISHNAKTTEEEQAAINVEHDLTA